MKYLSTRVAILILSCIYICYIIAGTLSLLSYAVSHIINAKQINEKRIILLYTYSAIKELKK